MWKTLLVAIAIVALMPHVGACQDAKTALEGVAKAMGGADLKSIQYSGSGSTFARWPEPKSHRAVATIQCQKLHPLD